MKKLVLFLMVLVPSSFYAQFPDECADAFPFENITGMPVGATCETSKFFVNTADIGPFTPSFPAASCVSAANNVEDFWLSFVATYTTTILNATVTGGDDIALELYSGDCSTSLSCSNTAGANGDESITYATTIGNTYIIRIIQVAPNNANQGMDMSLCIYSPGPPYNNCPGAIQICGDQAISENSIGPGVEDSFSGCIGVEHQSTWYVFQAATSGTIAFTISTTIDYDFSIWGPNSSCNSLGVPIRCSFSGTAGNTGLGNGATDNSEDASGDAWVAPLDVIAGETYYMLIDNFSSNTTPFMLDWTLTNGATLNCTPLSVELLFFDAALTNERSVDLHWKTNSETNSDYFVVYKSTDGINWTAIGEKDAAGNSTSELDYHLSDFDLAAFGKNYYKLKQVDFNGDFDYSDIRVVDLDRSEELSLFPNPAMNSVFVYTDKMSAYQVNFFDNFGQEININLKSIGNSFMEYDLSNLTGGIYFVKVSNALRTETLKLVVKK